jgi:hypothetical protein
MGRSVGGRGVEVEIEISRGGKGLGVEVVNGKGRERERVEAEGAETYGQFQGKSWVDGFDEKGVPDYDAQRDKEKPR